MTSISDKPEVLQLRAGKLVETLHEIERQGGTVESMAVVGTSGYKLRINWLERKKQPDLFGPEN